MHMLNCATVIFIAITLKLIVIHLKKIIKSNDSRVSSYSSAMRQLE